MKSQTLRFVALLCPLVMTFGCADSPTVPDTVLANTDAANSDETTTFTFPNGPVSVSLPVKTTVRVEAGDTVAVSPSSDAGITLRFNLHGLPDLDAEEFLLAQSKSKGTEIVRIGGKATFSESGARAEGDIQYEMTFWQIAFGDSLVVMSAEVDSERADDPATKELLAAVPAIIESMTKK